MKYTVRTYFFLFALFLIFSNEAVAFTLSGYVRSVNNEPVPFVTIHIKGTTTGVTTNTDGFYALEIPQGKYKVVYQSIGYLVQTIDVNVISDLTLDIVLKEDAVQLKEVEVKIGRAHV